MVRHRFHFTAALGHFNEARQWASELNRTSIAAGLRESKMLVPSFGKVNQVVIETEYPDWATFSAESDKFNSNADCMRVFREGTKYQAEGTWPWDETEEDAPLLA